MYAHEIQTSAYLKWPRVPKSTIIHNNKTKFMKKVVMTTQDFTKKPNVQLWTKVQKTKNPTLMLAVAIVVLLLNYTDSYNCCYGYYYGFVNCLFPTEVLYRITV